MNQEELFRICPPERPLTYPFQLTNDIKQLQLKLSNQKHELPVFVDSADLINLLTKQVKTYKEYTPYDLLTKIHYRKTEFDRNTKYYYRISRPIHYGWHDNEDSFIVRSNNVTDIDLLDQVYNQKVRETRVSRQIELEVQVATYTDILLINRRLIPYNLRAMNRVTDRKIIVFHYNWINGEIL